MQCKYKVLHIKERSDLDLENAALRQGTKYLQVSGTPYQQAIIGLLPFMDKK